MIPLTPSDSLTTKGSHSNQAAWSPPELLLEVAADDDALLVKVIDVFGRDTDTRMAQMRRALAASNYPNICAEAHTIKGCAMQMGAEAVGEACHQLEIACGLQEASLIAARLNRVQELFDEIRGAMVAYTISRGMKSSVTS